MTDFEMDRMLREISIPEPRPEWKKRVQSRLASKPWKRWMLIGGLAACAALGAAFHDDQVAELSFGGPHGQVKIKTRVEPVTAKLHWFGLESGLTVRADRGWVLRYVCDGRSQTVFGYEVKMSAPAPGRYRLEFQPLREDPRQLQKGACRGYRWESPLEIAQPREVAASEMVRVELRPQLRDELEVTPEAVSVSGRMKIVSPKLFEDGRLVVDNEGSGLAGQALVIFWPGESSLKLRLDQGLTGDHVEVGWVEGKVLEFDFNGHRYRLESTEVICEGGRRHVYGLRKGNHEPKGPVGFGSNG